MWANLTCTYRSPTQKTITMKLVIFKFLDALARFIWILREIYLERLNSFLDTLASKFAPWLAWWKATRQRLIKGLTTGGDNYAHLGNIGLSPFYCVVRTFLFDILPICLWTLKTLTSLLYVLGGIPFFISTRLSMNNAALPWHFFSRCFPLGGGNIYPTLMINPFVAKRQRGLMG